MSRFAPSLGLLCLTLIARPAVANEVTGLLPPRPALSPDASSLLCPTEYVDSFERLSAPVRAFEREQPTYTFCVRTSAVYECPVYSGDGTLHHQRKKAVAHGTAFGYRQQAGDTLLLTNDHVAEWPVVTDDAHPVDNVPAGCRRVSDALSIVDNDEDDYERDDIPLTRVVTDPGLDMAVLKAHQLLPILPWKIGKSAALHERNVVSVQGFPLGAFKANNVGKVISAFDHDDYKAWNHDDFVVDALLSPGNSGSPVLAISCKTGTFELVGVYHAGYTGGSALNLVIGIDQIRDLMTTLKRASRPRGDGTGPMDASGRAEVVSLLRSAPEAYFPLGPLAVSLRATPDGRLDYEVFSSDFPLHAAPAVVLEDVPSPDGTGFGQMGRVWFGSERGLRLQPRSELDAESQGVLEHVLAALRRDARAVLVARKTTRASDGSREQFRAAERLDRALRKAVQSRAELADALGDLAARLAPAEQEPALSLGEVWAQAASPVEAGSTGPTSPPGPAAPTANPEKRAFVGGLGTP